MSLNLQDNFRKMNKPYIWCMITGVIFIFYGYLSRVLKIYFFWESASIGWAITIGGLIWLLVHSLRIKKAKDQKAVGEKVGIGLLSFILFLTTLVTMGLSNSDACSAARSYLTRDAALRSELGEIKGFGAFPSGSLSISTGPSGSSGTAALKLLVKGEKKYMEVIIYLRKVPGQPNWEISDVE